MGLKDDARGCWRDILLAFGIPHEALTGRHTPCLFCGGKDRARWTNHEGDGTYLCNQCTPKVRSPITLIMDYCNISYDEAVARIRSMLDEKNYKPYIPRPVFDARKRLRETIAGAKPIAEGDVVHEYLKSRGIDALPSGIWTHPKLWENDLRMYFPAMLAVVVDSSGEPITLHRTYIKVINSLVPGLSDTSEAASKKFMTGIRKMRGCVCRLSHPEDGWVGLAEGIETALSASEMFNLPVWACLDTHNMETFQLPRDVEIDKVSIFADNDASYAGQAAATTLAKRLWNQRVEVEVRMPDTKGHDWNDELQLERTWYR